MLGLLDSLEPLDTKVAIRTRDVKPVDHPGSHQRTIPGDQRKYLILLLGDQEDQGIAITTSSSLRVQRTKIAPSLGLLDLESRQNVPGVGLENSCPEIGTSAFAPPFSLVAPRSAQ